MLTALVAMVYQLRCAALSPASVAVCGENENRAVHALQLCDEGVKGAAADIAPRATAKERLVGELLKAGAGADVLQL